MLKKGEVITILNEGGSVYIDDFHRRAHVYNAAGDRLDAVRYDTALNLEAIAKYKMHQRGHNTWQQREIYDPAAVAAAQEAAAEALESITTPGNITLRALADIHVGSYRVFKGRTYVITVYGDGSHDVPGNAYGKLYDFRADLHAVHFEIIDRPAEEQQQPEDDDQNDAHAAAEEAPERQPTAYLRADGDEATHSAAVALGWHRSGADVLVCRYGQSAVYIHGAPQEAPREEDENRATCRRIAKEIDAHARGDVRRCPECGEIHCRDWDDVGDVFKCPDCGTVAISNECDGGTWAAVWETVSLWEWLDNELLDIEYRCTGRKEYRSAQICIAWGGPNIYLDTATKDVELYWWNERARYPISYEAVDIIDEWAEEYWNI